jgi:hypothetical protein
MYVTAVLFGADMGHKFTDKYYVSNVHYILCL